MSKHTPGPWAVTRGYSIVTDATPAILLAKTASANYAANAQLIAAAPDTAEALSGLLKAFRECIGSAAFLDFEQSNPAVQAAQRALAKAGF